MAIELEIPEDIRKSKKKLIGPLTSRQVAFCVPAALVGFAVFKLTESLQGTNARIGIIFFAVLPFLLFGFIEIYGLPLEQFLKSAFVSTFLSPKNRLYKTENAFAIATEEAFKKEEMKQNGKKEKKKKKSKPSATHIQYK